MEKVIEHIMLPENDFPGDRPTMAPMDRARRSLIHHFARDAVYVDMGSPSIGLNFRFTEEESAAFAAQLRPAIEKVLERALADPIEEPEEAPQIGSD